MDIQTDIQWIKNELDSVKDPDLIEVFKRLLQLRRKTEVVTLEEYNQELKEAQERIENGRFMTSEQLSRHLKK